MKNGLSEANTQSEGRVILLDRELEEHHVKRLEKLAAAYELLPFTDELPAEKLKQAVAAIGWNQGMEEKTRQHQSPLRWIQTYSAGVDSLDRKALEAAGVVLTNASGIHGYPIRETIFGLLLAFARGIRAGIDSQAESRWDGDVDTWVLQGKTMLIYGTGAIGQATAELAKLGFGMRTIGVNTSGRPADYMDETVTVEKARDYIPEADFVIGILPLTDDTRGFFDRSFFGQMKEGAIFVNVGRGASVVTDDLTAGLKAGKPAYAGLDVTDPEPLPSGHPLWKQQNVIITPHISGKMSDYTDKAMEIFAENLESFVQTGRPSRNVVDYTRGY